MHKKILFLTSILLFCSSVIGSEKRSISPTTQGKLNQQLKQSIQNRDLSNFLKALQDGAQVNTRFAKDMTALHFATSKLGVRHKDDMIKTLLEHKAYPNVQDKDGETPLLRYVDQSWATPAIVALLLDAKADPTITDNNQDSPLTLIEDRPILEVFLQKGFYPQNSLPLARQLIQPHLLPFIKVKDIANIVVEYLVEKEEANHA